MDAPGRVPAAVNCHACYQVVDLNGLAGFSQVQCPHCQAMLVVPVEFGNFLLLESLGIGGVGAVYKALDLSLHRFVALKVLKPALAANPEFIESFAREARAAAAVTHINVAQVYTFGEQDGHYYLAMELLEKGSLDERITKQTKITEDEVLSIGLQIAQGLRAAYERNLLHRDVKPGNIMFNADNVPKIVDFGLARGREPHAAPAAGELVWGTPYYIAPEKLRGHTDDLRSDIYSLGASLFHALAGRPPFEAATATDVAVKHTTTPAYSLKAFVPGIQDQTAQTIGRMLAKNPAERYYSYDELIVDLEAAQAAHQKAQAQPGIVTETGERVSLSTLIGTLAALGVGLILVVLVIIYRHRIFGPPTPPAPPPSTVVPRKTTPATHAVAPELSFAVEMPWGRTWFLAGLAAAEGRLDDTQKAYADLRQVLGERPDYQRWVNYYEGLALLANERGADARALFARATNDLVSAELPASVTPDNFIGPLATAMLQPASLAGFERAVAPQPTWAVALTFFSSGCKHLDQGHLTLAMTAFQNANRIIAPEARRWIFVLHPLGERLAAECDLATRALDDSARLLKRSQPDAALKTVRDALTRIRHTGIRARLADQLTVAERAVADAARRQQDDAERRANEQRLAAERIRQQTADEAKQITGLAPAVAALCATYDFTGAVAKYDELARQFQFPANQKLAQDRATPARLLAEFKIQLAADCARQPYDRGDLQTRQNLPLAGKLARATDKQLIFILPYGESSTPWSDLSPATLRKLGEHYAQALSADPPATAARRYLTLAVFCRQFGFERPAAGYAEKALGLAPALKDEWDRVLAAAAQ